MKTNRSLVSPFSALGRDALPSAGGKGANLAALVRAGAPVPPGFVVTTDAYRRTIEEAGFDERLQGPHDPETLAALRTDLARLAPPIELADQIAAAYRRLGGGAVAVRSSGTAEDLPGAAFAGQHDTYLNVVGEEAVLAAVRDCWASLWTERAVDYRQRLEISGTDVTMAVVVQQMVDADVAGVMFTADPVRGDRDKAVVMASPGLGEALVSGQVTPDHYRVAKKSGRRIETTLGQAEMIIRSAVGGGTTESPGTARETPVLDRRQTRELVRLGQRIQDHFGTPQDIEWAYATGRFFVVQARPMTALPEPISHDLRLRPGAAMVSELMPLRLTPMDATTWTPTVIIGLRRFLGSMGVTVPLFETLVEDDHGVPVSVRPPMIKPGPKTPLILLRSVIKGDRYSSEKLLNDPRMRNLMATVAEARRRDLRRLDYALLAPALSEALRLVLVVLEVRTRFMAGSVLASGRFALSMKLLGLGKEIGTLMAGVETKTAETNRALEEMATTIRAHPDLARVFGETSAERLPGVLAETPGGPELLADVESFLDAYGHRESLVLYISLPSWRDAPQTVFGLLKGLAADPAGPGERVGLERAERRLFAHPLLRIGPIRRLVERQMEGARGFTQFREDTHFYATMAHPMARGILLEYGRRLTEAGALSEPEQIFWLRREDLDLAWPIDPAVAAEIRAVVAERQRIGEQYAGKPMVDPRYLEALAEIENALVSGVSGASGSATGPVRIIRSEKDFDLLRTGDVLVAPYTNPAWTPLFQRAVAVIVDTGSPGSHAAIVAREYGKPAVLGTRTAMETLTDGMRVMVDGDRGAVLPAG